MTEKQPTPPDWVNAVPARYGEDWPEARRCRHVFREPADYQNQGVRRRPCGYPTEEGQECCLFHREGDKDPDALRTALEDAVAHNAYLGEARLAGAVLQGANLCGALLPYADLSHADLAFADFSDARVTSADFSGANLWFTVLTDARLAWARLTPETNLHEVTWWADATTPSVWRQWLHGGEQMLRDEAEAADHRSLWQRLRVLLSPRLREAARAEAAERDYELEACVRLYRQVKRCYQEAGQYEQAGVFFIREMECRRKQLPRWSPLWLVYHVLHFVSDYFENPWRVSVIAALVVLLGAFLQGTVGIHLAANSSTGEEGPTMVGPGLTWPSLGGLIAYGHALYFSAITFTATGYGDYVPAWGWGQLIAAFETLSGAFLMAMFLVCLARKFGRA